MLLIANYATFRNAAQNVSRTTPVPPENSVRLSGKGLTPIAVGPHGTELSLSAVMGGGGKCENGRS